MDQMPRHDSKKEVVTILPFIGDRVLMQLRDFNAHIKHPGHWGYFSGSIHEGERSAHAAKRELFEEIGYTPNELIELGRLSTADQEGLVVYLYSCSIRIPLEELVLGEGLDMALVAPKEILSKMIYSKALKKFFPVAETSIIAEALAIALASRK